MFVRWTRSSRPTYIGPETASLLICSLHQPSVLIRTQVATEMFLEDG